MKTIKIGDIYYLKCKKENITSNMVRPIRKLTVIGLFYEGSQGNSNWKEVSDMMDNLKLMIQFSCESHYTFGNPINYIQSFKSFIRELEKDNKLLPEHRKYTN